MRRFKFLATILLILSLSLALFACGGGGCKHVDDNGDGICEICEKEYTPEEKDVLLIDDEGVPAFQIVLASDVDSTVKMKLQTLVSDLEDVDIEIDIVDDKEETKSACEVLIGSVESRGPKFFVDAHSLGNKGYIVKIVDGKVLINGGSADALGEAVDIFIEDILEFDGDEIWDVTMKLDQQVDETQDDYSITSVKINGNEINGYTIACDLTTPVYYNAAKNIQSTLYNRTGYWLEIVALDKADKSIVLNSKDKVYSDESFKISASGTKLLIECAFDNKLANTLSAFLTSTFTNGEGDINLEGTVFKKDISFVTYEEFGATNNGKKDNDFEAIYKAHKFANEGGQKVIISGAPEYYISHGKAEGKHTTIPIMTDTNWGSAKFIIDDSLFDVYNSDHQGSYTKHIFTVEASQNKTTISKDKLPESMQILPGMDKIDLELGYDALIVPVYSGHKVYRRRGYWALTLGVNLGEILVVDGEGNISDDTPIMWDYTGIDYIDVYYIDREPLTIEGGTFTTIATKSSIYKEINGKREMRDNYFSRGISVKRSNTIVKGTEHYIENEITLKEQIEELLIGVTYSGFFTANFATNVTFDSCVLTGHRCFTKPAIWGGGGTQGTYDFRAGYANNVLLKDCVQSNFWVTVDSDGKISAATKETSGATVSMAKANDFGNVLMHWGIGETDFCKNVEYNGCTLSRFDAHEGLYNGKIINSTVNIIALTGKGRMLIEGSTQYSLDPSSTYNTLLHMRGDYGSTWDGEIIIKDHTSYLYESEAYVFMHSYVNWYYGYQCVFPSIELNNVKFYDAESFYTTKAIVPFAESTRVKLNTGAHIKNEPQLHLSTTKNLSPWYAYSDYDGDGLVDNFDKLYCDLGQGQLVQGWDFNSDKKIDNVDKTYNPDYLGRTAEVQWDNGMQVTNSKVNLNPVKPPEFIKVINCNATIEVYDTSDVAGGGFFGNTKFYYTAADFYTGTGEDTSDNDNNKFFFAK